MRRAREGGRVRGDRAGGPRTLEAGRAGERHRDAGGERLRPDAEDPTPPAGAGRHDPRPGGDGLRGRGRRASSRCQPAFRPTSPSPSSPPSWRWRSAAWREEARVVSRNDQARRVRGGAVRSALGDPRRRPGHRRHRHPPASRDQAGGGPHRVVRAGHRRPHRPGLHIPAPRNMEAARQRRGGRRAADRRGRAARAARRADRTRRGRAARTSGCPPQVGDRLQRRGATMTDRAATLERLGTGSAPLDAILGGGIPSRSVTVVAGEPGAGKTVFTLQALFHHARQGKKCLYFSTLSEPALKTIRYVQALLVLRRPPDRGPSRVRRSRLGAPRRRRPRRRCSR